MKPAPTIYDLMRFCDEFRAALRAEPEREAEIKAKWVPRFYAAIPALILQSTGTHDLTESPALYAHLGFSDPRDPGELPALWLSGGSLASEFPITRRQFVELYEWARLAGFIDLWTNEAEDREKVRAVPTSFAGLMERMKEELEDSSSLPENVPPPL